VQRALELGKPATGANMWAEGRKLARVPLGNAGAGVTPYPYILVLGQDDNERSWASGCATGAWSVQWNSELTGLVQHAGHVAATVKEPDGTSRVIIAAWVAGCDGAHSAVREACGITFPGAPYEHVFFRRPTSRRRANMVGGRGQRLPVARRLSSFLPDARQRITGGSSASFPPRCVTAMTPPSAR